MIERRRICGGGTKHLNCAILVLAVFLVGEISLRIYGFCNSPLYYNDQFTGYNLLPNQDVKRFGNRFITNAFSMRSEQLLNDMYRVLLVGDSVLNGGVQTDQSKLASTMLDEKYRSKYDDIQILNISCGGWGIDNAAGVFKEYGDFDAKCIILVFNSHDAVGKISSSLVAGNSKSFPDKQYSLAWIELFDRYLIPRIKSLLKIKDNNYTNEINTSSGEETSEGWDFFYEMSKELDIPLVIYLHAEKEEMVTGDYDENGHWIINFAGQRNIPIVYDIEFVNENDYRDDIHFSESGQHVIFEVLDPVIEDYLSRR